MHHEEVQGVAESHEVGLIAFMVAFAFVFTPKNVVKMWLGQDVKGLPKLSGKELDAAVEIVWRESRFDTNARNKRSSAYGLGQLLRSTQNAMSRHGYRTTHRGEDQLAAMRKYVHGRYGTFRKALSHHDKRGWY